MQKLNLTIAKYPFDERINEKKEKEIQLDYINPRIRVVEFKSNLNSRLDTSELKSFRNDVQK